jgi:hypothetical protein
MQYQVCRHVLRNMYLQRNYHFHFHIPETAREG